MCAILGVFSTKRFICTHLERKKRAAVLCVRSSPAQDAHRHHDQHLEKTARVSTLHAATCHCSRRMNCFSCLTSSDEVPYCINTTWQRRIDARVPCRHRSQKTISTQAWHSSACIDSFVSIRRLSLPALPYVCHASMQKTRKFSLASRSDSPQFWR